MLLASGEKTIESQGVFANVRVDEQGDFGVEIAERCKGGKRHGNKIADAADIEDYLVGSFFEKTPAKKSDHRLPVLPRKSRGVNEVREGRRKSQRWVTAVTDER